MNDNHRGGRRRARTKNGKGREGVQGTGDQTVPTNDAREKRRDLGKRSGKGGGTPEEEGEDEGKRTSLASPRGGRARRRKSVRKRIKFLAAGDQG